MSEKKMLQGIASILEETLPEDWSKVVFYAEYAEGAFSIEYYVAGSGKDDFVKCFDQKGVSRASLMKNFMAINKFIEPERAALKPEKRWGSMTLILHSNGKFKVDYDYSDMTENAYRKVTEDELEYERRESRFRYQLQRNTELSVARNEGEAIGLKKGRTEGEAIGLKKGRSEGAVQKQREIAKNFKHAGIPIDVIAENTGLTIEEIENL